MNVFKQETPFKIARLSLRAKIQLRYNSQRNEKYCPYIFFGFKPDFFAMQINNHFRDI